MINGVMWVNRELFTPLELVLFGVGSFLWVIVYGIHIRNIFKDKFVEMPIFAACSNFGWEFTWSFLAATNMGLLFQLGYQAWFFFDIFIFYGVLRYGWKQVATPQLRPYWVPLCIFTTVAMATAYALMRSCGLDTPAGGNSAYIAQLFISVLYIILIARQKSLAYFSFTATWMRTLGTGLISIFMVICEANAGNYFLHFMAIVATTLDCCCTVIFWRKRRAEAAMS